MSVKQLAEGYIEISGNTGTIKNSLTVSGTVNLPSATNLSGSSLQTSLNVKAPLANPTFTGAVAFQNLQINNVPFQDLVSTSGGSASTITLGAAVIVSGDIYTVQIPFSSPVTLPYTANIVVNEISGVAMTVVITEYNTNYVRFRIMKPVFDYIVINDFINSLNINCSITKGAIVIACGNIQIQPTITDAGAIEAIRSQSTCVAAYSLRRLFDSYSGPQIRIKRNGTSIETDVYYDKSGIVTTVTGYASLTAFASAEAILIVTWYDQSGKGYNGTGFGSPILNYTTTPTKHSINLSRARYIEIAANNDLIINTQTTPFWVYAAFDGNGLVSPNSLLGRYSGGSTSTDYRIWYDNPNWTWGTGASANTNAWMTIGGSVGRTTACVIAASHLPLVGTSGTKNFVAYGPSGGIMARNVITSGKATITTTIPLRIGDPSHQFIGVVHEVLIFRSDTTGSVHNTLINNLITQYI